MDFLPFSFSSSILADHAGFSAPRLQLTHPDRILPSYEMFFVRSGTLSLEEDGKQFKLHKDEALLLWPGRRHKGTDAFTKDLTFFWLHFRLEEKGNREARKAPQFAKVRRPECLSELFHRYLSDQEYGILTPGEASCLVTLMLMEMGRSEFSPPTLKPFLAERANLYIEENYHTGIHASQVAKAVGCSADYLGSVYRKAFNLTLSQAIHQKQVYEARTLLRDSTMNIDQIAQACGFKDQRYFSRVFTRLQGIAPRAYREMYSRMTIKAR